jgi:hypothetical protein
MAPKKVTEKFSPAKPQSKGPVSPAPGSDPRERIKVEPTPEGYESFFGTRDDLIASGICTEEQFPLPPRRSISYSCKLGNWTTSKVKGGYRHQVEGRKAMAKCRIMEAMQDEISLSVHEFARQLWIDICRVKPDPRGPFSLVNDSRFHMTEKSYKQLWSAANHLYRTALDIEISYDSPAFDFAQKPPRRRPKLTLVN